MSDRDAALIRRVIGYLTGLSVLIAGVCLISACLSIYFGEGEYTREIVENAFAPISLAVFVCPILAVIGFIAELFLPVNANKTKKNESLSLLLKRLQAVKDGALPEIENERRKRARRKAVLAVILALSSVVFLVYSLNTANFDKTEINTSMINAMCLLTPLLLICFIASIIVEILNEKSVKREIELLRKAGKKAENEEAKGESRDITIAVKLCVLLIAVFLIVYGYILGGTADVLTKAVNICTECIGLG